MTEIPKNVDINGSAHLVNIDYHFDERGSFSSLMPLATRFFSHPPKQINISHNNLKGTVRGLHLQKPLEMKIIKCLQGKIFDVIVDCRKNSGNFGKWESFELSEDDNKALFIPSGFAHGFQTLTNDSKIMYLHSEEYFPENQFGISSKDEKLRIPWPLDFTVISNRDSSLPGFQELQNEL